MLIPLILLLIAPFNFASASVITLKTTHPIPGHENLTVISYTFTGKNQKIYSCIYDSKKKHRLIQQEVFWRVRDAFRAHDKMVKELMKRFSIPIHMYNSKQLFTIYEWDETDLALQGYDSDCKEESPELINTEVFKELVHKLR